MKINHKNENWYHCRWLKWTYFNTTKILIQANFKHILIAFWSLQNTYLAKHLWMLDSTHKKLFTRYLKTTWLSACISEIPSCNLPVQSYIRNSRTRSKICWKLKRKTPEWHQLTVCSCQLTSFWCLLLLMLDMFHNSF